MQGAVAVAGRQGLAASVGLVVVAASPLGLGWAVPVVAGACSFGAFTWALRQGEGLERSHVRAVAVRAGALWSGLVAVAYLVVALQPGQLALPIAGVLVAAAVLAALGGLAAAALSLCGIDATSKVR